MPRKRAETGKGPERGASTGGGRRGAKRPDGTWTFVSNHLLVLICVAEDPGIRIADVAERLQITERAVQAIVADLVASGYLTRIRVGRRNQYEIDRRMPLRHVETQHRLLGDLLALLAHGEETEQGRR
jgi:DNA-binding MarR family transcriptional regulator